MPRPAERQNRREPTPRDDIRVVYAAESRKIHLVPGVFENHSLANDRLHLDRAYCSLEESMSIQLNEE